MLRRLAFVIAVATALLAVACSSDGGGARDATLEPRSDREPGAGVEATRSGEAGGVTVEARWLTAGDLGAVDADLGPYPLDEFVLLEVNLDTHSGDLNEIDLEQTAALRQTGAEVQAQAWVSISDDLHHRQGVLVFPRAWENGPVELVLTIGDEEVALLWEAAPST